MKSCRTLIVFLIVLLVCACGNPNVPSDQQSKVLKQSEEQQANCVFPLSGVIKKILKGSTVQVLMESESKHLTVEVSQKTKVVFNAQPTSVDALAPGQTVYIESDDSKTVSVIIIKNWPGFDAVGETVAISTDMVFERVIDFIRLNHTELGLPETKQWNVGKKETVFEDNRVLKILNWNKFKLRMIWIKNQTEPEYDVMLTIDGDVTAVWSGRFRKDGQVLEERYEKP